MIADTVLCFDRDSTIDVNPHPDHDAVPIAWVKAWAHAPEHEHIDVWATGNQRLAGEARIPGTEHARSCWERLEGRDPSDEYPTEESTVLSLSRRVLRTILPNLDTTFSRENHDYQPGRRDRLRLIKDCYEHPDSGYEDLPRFLVVDNATLSDIDGEGWQWWLPWEFTESVRHRGEPLTVPDTTDYPNKPVGLDDREAQYTLSASILQ